jgi:hypothetical protein
VQLNNSDLIIPVNINSQLPFGSIDLFVYQHYMCGLSMYLEGMMKKIDNILPEDRAIIESKLMDILNKMSKGTKQ